MIQIGHAGNSPFINSTIHGHIKKRDANYNSSVVYGYGDITALSSGSGANGLVSAL